MIDLRYGDCLEVMKEIPDESVNLILCDLPYGTTKCKWDIVIPFDKLWEQYNRLIKEDGANVKNHIRKGVEIDVVDFHRNLIESLGFELLYSDYIKTSGLKYGNNSDRRVDGEYILTFMKG